MFVAALWTRVPDKPQVSNNRFWIKNVGGGDDVRQVLPLARPALATDQHDGVDLVGEGPDRPADISLLQAGVDLGKGKDHPVAKVSGR